MKKIFIIIGMMFMFILGACAITTDSSESVEQTWPLKIWAQNENGEFEILCIIDEDTGVNYVVVSRYNIRGTIAICPRYNADGTLYTGE